MNDGVRAIDQSLLKGLADEHLEIPPVGLSESGKVSNPIHYPELALDVRFRNQRTSGNAPLKTLATEVRFSAWRTFPQAENVRDTPVTRHSHHHPVTPAHPAGSSPPSCCRAHGCRSWWSPGSIVPRPVDVGIRGPRAVMPSLAGETNRIQEAGWLRGIRKRRGLRTP